MTDIFAKGTLLKIGNGAGTEVFTTIAQVTNISGPTLRRDTIDTTAHDSTGQWREFIAGLKDGGELTFEINYDPDEATHKNAAGGVLYDFDQGTKRNFQLVFTDATPTTWTVPAYITGFSTTEPVDDKLGASITLKVSGGPTLA